MTAPAKLAALLAVAALAGGAGGAAIAVVLDDSGATTVVRELGAESPAPAAFERGGGSIEEIYRRAAPGVVQITSTVVSDDFLFGAQESSSLGSGFVLDKSGHIVTNYHVVEGAEEVQVNFSSDDRIKAEVVGADASTDIAVLRIDAQARALTPLPLGDSDHVQVGDAVVAIGNPFGLERTATAGIVSALQREIQAPNGFTIDEVIQTDAAINRGNSGGPLLDANGDVIGVNTAIFSPSGGNVGIGFAVPIATVREVVSQLIEHGKVEHAWLGIEMQTIDERVAETFRLPVDEGVLVSAVQPGSPAAEAGLQGGTTTVVLDGQSYVLGGDVITRAAGRPIESAEELAGVVAEKKPGDELELEIRRDDATEEIAVTLGRRPASTG